MFRRVPSDLACLAIAPYTGPVSPIIPAADDTFIKSRLLIYVAFVIP